MKTNKEWLDNIAKRYDMINEIVMYMVGSKRTWTDDDIYRLFTIDDKELEEILDFFIQQKAEANRTRVTITPEPLTRVKK